MPNLGRIAFCLLSVSSAALTASGCNLVEPATTVLEHDVGAASGSSRSADVEKTLADAEWVVATPAAQTNESNEATPRGHWRHSGLEAVLSRNDARARLRQAIRSSDAAVSTTAAIGLASLNDPRVLKSLEQAARDTALKLAARGAAIEAIGQLETAHADDALVSLLEEFGQFRGTARARYVPELHAELVRAIACRNGDRHAKSIQDALESPAAPVRLAATQAYLKGRRTLPKELLDRAADEVPSIRAASIQALAQAQHAEAQACALRGLNDHHLAVRLAAIEALGLLPAAENSARLNELAKDDTDVIRAAAVKALAVRGDAHAVAKAVEDKSWRVRSAVAESLLELSYGQREPLAQALVADASLEVQRRMVQSLANWPLDEAIPLLLAAVEGRTAATRRDAVEQLQARWQVAVELSPHATREVLVAEAARLREIWQREYGADLTRGAAVADDHSQHEASEPSIGDVVAIVERLADQSVHERRAAARELSLNHRDTLLPDQALVRLRELVERETDALVWNDVLIFIGRDGRAAAADLAAIAASHPSADVRRRACGYFGEHPGARATELLLNSLADDDASIVREAVRSLGNQPEVPQLAPLLSLLTSADDVLRLETAATLARHGSPEGIRALLRSTHHGDPAVRRQAAIALGVVLAQSPTRQPISDPVRQEAIAELKRLLDDKGDVRRAAAASLATLGELPSP